MSLSHIVAISKNRAIGKDGKIPWYLPEDLKKFKARTQQHTILMGRKTYESIGKPLPKRRNIVVSRTMKKPEGVELELVSSLEEALKLCPPDEESFIIGGAEIYAQTMDKIDRIYLTTVDRVVEGDAFYPEIPADFDVTGMELFEGFYIATFTRRPIEKSRC